MNIRTSILLCCLLSATSLLPAAVAAELSIDATSFHFKEKRNVGLPGQQSTILVYEATGANVHKCSLDVTFDSASSVSDLVAMNVQVFRRVPLLKPLSIVKRPTATAGEDTAVIALVSNFESGSTFMAIGQRFSSLPDGMLRKTHVECTFQQGMFSKTGEFDKIQEKWTDALFAMAADLSDGNAGADAATAK